MITRIHQMGARQITDLEILIKHCKENDGNTLPIYKHLIDKQHTLACNTLYYADNKLVGYLRPFFFYTTACEVALMVDPAYRRRGIARALLQDILPIVTQENICSLFFSSPKNQAQDWLHALGLQYHHSEFQMRFDPAKKSTIPYKRVHIRMASHADIPTLVALDTLCFPKKNHNLADLFESLLLKTTNCVIFLLIQEDRIVGKAHIFKESDRARITDIGVFPDYRRQGIAGALIKHCINHALINNKPYIALDVEASNESALKLYDSLGFAINNSHDYWETTGPAPEFGLANFLHGNSKQQSPYKDAL